MNFNFLKKKVKVCRSVYSIYNTGISLTLPASLVFLPFIVV